MDEWIDWLIALWPVSIFSQFIGDMIIITISVYLIIITISVYLIITDCRSRCWWKAILQPITGSTRRYWCWCHDLSFYYHLSIHLSMNVFIYLFIYPSMYLCIYLSMYFFIYLFMYPSMYLCIYLSMHFFHLFIHLSIYVLMYLSIYVCFYLFICLCIYLHIDNQSIHTFIYSHVIVFLPRTSNFILRHLSIDRSI